VCFASENITNYTANSSSHYNSDLNYTDHEDISAATGEVENISEGAAGSLSEQYINANGIWIRSDDISLINGTALKNAGITDVFVKVSRVVAYQTTLNQLTQVKQLLSGTGIRVHAWVTCFLDANGNWVDPQNTTVQDEVLSFTSYLASSNLVDGIHLDYVRYPGTAYLHSGGTEAITQFVARVNTAVNTANPLVALSAALMPEGAVNAYYYGQDYSQLAQYLDFLVPMVYKGNYGEDSEWIGEKTAYIVSQANGTPVLVGLQTYVSDSNLSTLLATELTKDMDEALENGASGYVFFRYGLINSSYLAGGAFDAAQDLTAPVISVVDPVNKAVNVALDKVIKVTYNEPIKAGTMWIELLNSSGANVPITCTVNGNTLTITPNNYLTNGTKYTVAIHTGAVTDLTGNPAASKVTTFTTITDKTPPAVSTIDPVNNAVDVANDKVISVTYNEVIKAGSMWIELFTTTGANVPVTCTISGNTLTITPTSNLDNGTKHTLAIHTGAVTDLNGNPTAAKVTTFTSEGASGAPTTSFAFNDVIDAAGRVKDFIAVNHRMPTYVEISSVQVSMPQLLYLFTTATVQANSKVTSPLTLLSVSDSTNPSESTTIGTIYQAEIVDIANRVKSYIGSNYRLPNYTTTSRGQAGSESLIDLYSRVLVFYDSNQRLPTYATITPWLIEDYNSPASNLAYSADLQQYLSATTNCQSNDSRIIALAQSITADCTTTYEMGLAIYNWVRAYMDYSFYYNSQKGAVDSMLNGSANCCDLSHLLVALSRAVNLPARYKHGTCTFSSGTYGHVWAEIYVNGKWVTADASSNANSFGTITNWNTSTYILKGTYATLPF